MKENQEIRAWSLLISTLICKGMEFDKLIDVGNEVYKYISYKNNYPNETLTKKLLDGLTKNKDKPKRMSDIHI
jgi:hypothetical protein